MSGITSKKLKFKGDKPKKKKRSHREAEDPDEELAAMAAADPRGGRTLFTCSNHPVKLRHGFLGWVFPEDVMQVNGPSFIILPTEPPSCLAVSSALLDEF